MGDNSLHARHVMNGIAMYADASDNLLYVTRLLFNNNANAVIISKGGVPVGIVTSKDILRSLIKLDKDPGEILASEIMTAPIISADHEDDLLRVRELMLEFGVKKLPVKREYIVIGMIIQPDLLRDLSWTKQ